MHLASLATARGPPPRQPIITTFDHVQPFLPPIATDRYRCGAHHAPMTKGEKENLYGYMAIIIEELESLHEYGRRISLSTTEVCSPSLLAAPMPATVGSLSTSFAPLATPNHWLQCQMALELCALRPTPAHLCLRYGEAH